MTPSGAQIIDAMLLVVDITKGIQTQTAEVRTVSAFLCVTLSVVQSLVIGEVLMDQLVIVLNKVDLIPTEKRAAHVEKVSSGEQHRSVLNPPAGQGGHLQGAFQDPVRQPEVCRCCCTNCVDALLGASEE